MNKTILGVTLAGAAGLFMMAGSLTAQPQSLVECGEDGCFPVRLASTNEMERDPVVREYAQAGRCDEMRGVARRGCENIEWGLKNL